MDGTSPWCRLYVDAPAVGALPRPDLGPQRVHRCSNAPVGTPPIEQYPIEDGTKHDSEPCDVGQSHLVNGLVI